MKKRVISAFLCIVMLLALLPTFVLPSSAASLPISVSDSFMGSSYYTAAVNAFSSHLDNDRERFIQMALSQVGYKGGTSSGQYAGNGTGGMYTEYSRYMNVDGKAWCASFVSWCAAAAGVTDVVEKGAACGHWRTSKTGTFQKLWSADYKTYIDYKPVPGDIVLFMPQCDSCKGNYNSYSLTAHAGIVVSVSSSKNSAGGYDFTYVERNDNTVKKSTNSTKMSRPSNQICDCGAHTVNGTVHVYQGFFHPNWDDCSFTPPVPSVTPTIKRPTIEDDLRFFSVGDKSAEISAIITKGKGAHVSNVGLTVYDVTNVAGAVNTATDKITWSSAWPEPFIDGWYDFGEIDDNVTSWIVSYGFYAHGYTLQPGHIYVYRYYCKVDGETYKDNYQYFQTIGDNSLSLNPLSPVVSETNAELCLEINKPWGSRPQQIWLCLYELPDSCDVSAPLTKDSNWIYLKDIEFYGWDSVNCRHLEYAVDITEDMGLTLKPDTKYAYKFILDITGMAAQPATDYLGFLTRGGIQTGWLQDADGKWTYGKADGTLAAGWEKIDGKWYLFNAEGIMLTGWQKDGSKWYYLGTDGTMRTKWQLIDGKWYYLGSDGAMQTKWQQIGGKWYYLGSDGAMQTKWQQISGKWYYLGTDGAMRTDWQQIGGKWYYLGTDGAMQTKWQRIGGKWYYLGSDGAMRTGWQQISGVWYYLGSDGAMYASKWYQENGKWYYFKSDGAMAKSESVTIDGKTYKFNASGVWTNT